MAIYDDALREACTSNEKNLSPAFHISSVGAGRLWPSAAHNAGIASHVVALDIPEYRRASHIFILGIVKRLKALFLMIE